MGIISTYINDYRTTKTIDAIVEETNAFLRTRSECLNMVAPTKEYRSRDFLGIITDRLVPAAKIIAFGQEIPTVKQGRFRRFRADMFKIALSLAYDEELQWKMLEAMELANLKGVTVEDQMDSYTGKIVREGSNMDLAKQIFGNVKSLVQGIMDKMDALTWEALQTGKISYQSVSSNIPIELDFLQGASYNTALHFPAALVNTGNPIKETNIWSDSENADGLQNLYNLHDQYIETNGFSADKIVMSRRLYNHLLQQQTTKEAARSITATAVGSVTPAMLNSSLEARGIPPIELVDDLYHTEDPQTMDLIPTKFVEIDRVTFLKKDMCIRAIGQTLESSTNTIEDGSMVPTPKTGIYVHTFEKMKSPILDVTEAIMIGVPIIMNSKLLMSQVVN